LGRSAGHVPGHVPELLRIGPHAAAPVVGKNIVLAHPQRTEIPLQNKPLSA
jgi:hypothetical protein